MRAEVDLELGKVNDLYNERCRDFAQMVSDECEGEISKTVAGMRKQGSHDGNLQGALLHTRLLCGLAHF